MEATVRGGAGFHQRDLSGKTSSSIAPTIGVAVDITFNPPHKEHFTIGLGVGRVVSVGLVIGEDIKGSQTFGIRISGGPALPRFPVNISGPFDRSAVPDSIDLEG